MNSFLRSKVFGNKFGGDKDGCRPLFDVVMFGDYLESTAPYASQLPIFGQKPGMNDPIGLPELAGVPYIRPMQDKRKHRAACIRLTAGEQFEYSSLDAALQMYQGGQMGKLIKPHDRDRFQAENPNGFLHGNATIGGAIAIGNIMPRDKVTKIAIPIVRTDPTDQPLFRMTAEGSATYVTHRRLLDARKCYTKARRARSNRNSGKDALTTLESDLRENQREQEANEVEKLIRTDPKDRDVDKWLTAKHEALKKEMVRQNVPNVESRQALPGYLVTPAYTVFTQLITAMGIPDIHAGLMFLAFFQRDPSLGGRKATGCGAYLRRVYRVCISSDASIPPAFDCLFKVEPFKALEICLDDHNIDEWTQVKSLKWCNPLAPDAPDCFVTRSIKAWQNCEKDFDYNFVPRGPVIENEVETNNED